MNRDTSLEPPLLTVCSGGYCL
uniref:Uncharacterized protein n=1 Tax=Anguilla anguilla TaxID=7936 RepID=A0A0E9QTL6_ANGAN